MKLGLLTTYILTVALAAASYGQTPDFIPAAAYPTSGDAAFTTAADFQDPAAWRPEPAIKAGFGWGTLLTNDFRGCHPRGGDLLDPISLVCKVTAANGRPAVKLSDNYAKATGPAEAVARYRAVFGSRGLSNLPVEV